MLWVWPEEHFGLANCIMLGIGHHMNTENAFLERIEILSTIAKKDVLVLQNLHALYCTWKAECQPHPALTYIAAFLFSFDAAFDSGHYSNLNIDFFLVDQNLNIDECSLHGKVLSIFSNAEAQGSNKELANLSGKQNCGCSLEKGQCIKTSRFCLPTEATNQTGSCITVVGPIWSFHSTPKKNQSFKNMKSTLQCNNLFLYFVDVLKVTNMGAHTPDDVSKAFSHNCSYNPDVFSFNCFLLLLSYIVNIRLHLYLNSISEFKLGTWVTHRLHVPTSKPE